MDIKSMTEEGFAKRRIAHILGLSFEDVKNEIDKNNYAIIKENFNESKIDHICDLYKRGVSAKQLGIKYSIDKRRIQKWAEAKGYLRDLNRSHRIIEFNENLFDTIDSIDKAYWLGFLYADAYNNMKTNTISVALKLEDIVHLEKLAKLFGLSKDKINIYDSVTKYKGKKKYYPTCSIRFYSKNLCTKLASLGCTQAKSFTIQYPQWLDPSFNAHFIRGLFDGDGCITYRKKQNEWKWSLVSTRECCESIQNIILNELNFIVNYHCISKTNNNTFELESSGNEKILTILEWTLKNSSNDNRLNRKYQKYLQLKEQQEKRNKRLGRENYFLVK